MSHLPTCLRVSAVSGLFPSVPLLLLTGTTASESSFVARKTYDDVERFYLSASSPLTLPTFVLPSSRQPPPVPPIIILCENFHESLKNKVRHMTFFPNADCLSSSTPLSCLPLQLLFFFSANLHPLFPRFSTLQFVPGFDVSAFPNPYSFLIFWFAIKVTP